MARLKIKDAPLLPSIQGDEKIPTGMRGDYTVTPDMLSNYIQLKLPFVTKTELAQVKYGLEQQVETVQTTLSSSISTLSGRVTSVESSMLGFTQDLDLHKADKSNPHNVTKAQVGLGNVDNTSDVDKSISNLTQEALNLKASKSYVESELNLKANSTTVDTALALKADKSYVESELNLKANSTTVDTALALKASKSYVDTQDSSLQSQINQKTTTSYVDSALAEQTQTINNALSQLSTVATKFYPTLAEANADIANLTVNQAVDIGEVVNGGLWYKATAGATNLTKSAYDPLTQSKQYVDNLLASELSTSTNLNTLTVGNYFLSSTNLVALVGAGNFVALGYPADTVKIGAVKINVVRKGSLTYQTLEFPQQGRILMRQGAIGSSFTPWISGISDAIKYTDNELNKKFGTVTAGASLNTFINAGTWGISGSIVAADSKNTGLGYPAELFASSAVLTVAQTASNYAIQELTHGTKKYKRILNRANSSVFEDWSIIGGDTITDYAKKGVVASLKDLNTYTDEGIFACTSAVMKSGIESGNLNYPTFLDAVGGGLLIVSKSGNYPYQVFIATRQKKIAVRQGESATYYSPWVNMLDIVPSIKKTFLAFGSSSFAYMSAKIKAMIESFNATYISDAIGGQILETMQAHQGSNPVSITFNDGLTALNNVASAVTVTQKDEIGSLSAKGSFVVTLSNGLKGTLNLDANTFTASNATEIYNVDSLNFDVDFGYFDYAQSAYHIFNVGKNNITMGNYTAQQVLDETNKMIDFVKNKGNQNFIVGGHFVDRDMVTSQKQVVLDVNVALKAKYGMKYFDMQDYLMSAQIWTDLNITPTQDDLDKQAVGELAVSLSRDSRHMSAEVDTLTVGRLKQKLQDMSYL